MEEKEDVPLEKLRRASDLTLLGSVGVGTGKVSRGGLRSLLMEEKQNQRGGNGQKKLQGDR